VTLAKTIYQSPAQMEAKLPVMDLRLLFVGDVMLGRLVNDALERVGPEYPWGNALPIFREADWRACNLECVISDRGRPWGITPKEFHFRSDARNVAVLKAAGIDAVSLANNHTLDYEYDAMFEMLAILDRAHIARAGAGVDLAEASASAISNVNGNRIGLIAFTDNQPEWEAHPDRAGIFYVPAQVDDKRAQRLLEIVRQTKQKVGFLVVSAHWGPNWGYEPPAEHVRFGHALIDAGADIIFGHSGHVFRGVEIYKRRPIIYCAGNFIDDYAVDEIERNDQSVIFMVDIRGGWIRGMRLYPTVIVDFQAHLAQKWEAQKIAFKMRELCLKLNTPARWLEVERRLEISIG